MGMPSNGPSAHLAWSEIDCEDGTPYPEEWRTSRAVRLAQAFEALRSECGGRPLVVLSGYRTPTHNKKVGGKPSSYHLKGLALDIVCPAHLDYEDFVEKCQAVGRRGLLRGIGVNKLKHTVHVDCRPGKGVLVFPD